MQWPAILTMKASTVCAGTLMLAFSFAASKIALSSLDLSKGEATLGAVASENKICSRIGIDLLEAGGNAADAVCRKHSRFLVGRVVSKEWVMFKVVIKRLTLALLDGWYGLLCGRYW